MWQLLAKMFGSDKVIDAGISAADAIFFTDEEKADWKIRVLKAYEPFKLAQRYLALVTTIPFVALHVIAAIQIFASGWLGDSLGKAVHEAAMNVIEQNNEALGLPVAIVLAFYFGGGAAEGMIRAKTGK